MLGRSQAEIAELMGTSRSNVSRMLTEAQKQGIVEIRINDPEGRVHESEDDLRAVRPRDVRVAHAAPGPGLRVEDQVGTQAARLLLDNIKDSMTVALSWGHALQSMVYATTSDLEFHGLNLVQLVGACPRSATRSAARSSSASSPYASRRSTASCTHRRRSKSAVARRAAGGAVHRRRARRGEPRRPGLRGDRHSSRGSSAAILASMNLSPADQSAFWSAQPSATSPRATTTPRAGRSTARSRPDPRGHLDELLRIPNVVGVAQGRAKTPGVLGALRGHIIDSLVCDDTLARSLLSEARTSPNDTGGI